jgi:hypothetical protein
MELEPCPDCETMVRRGLLVVLAVLAGMAATAIAFFIM